MREELFEALAIIEHQRWGDWQRWMHDQGTRNPDGSVTIPTAMVERWDALIGTPYADLEERSKESDREQVRRYWSLIEPLIAMAEAANDLELPVVVSLPRSLYSYLSETYHDDPDVATTIRDICVSMQNADREPPQR